jgi:hypothetical protein
MWFLRVVHQPFERRLRQCQLLGVLFGHLHLASVGIVSHDLVMQLLCCNYQGRAAIFCYCVHVCPELINQETRHIKVSHPSYDVQGRAAILRFSIDINSGLRN